MMKYVVGMMTVAVLLSCCTADNVFAVSGNSKESRSAGAKTDTNGDETLSELDQAMYPFVKVDSMSKEDVAGLIIDNNAVYMLSFDKHFCPVQGSDATAEVDFSDLDFFHQYPKLASVEIRNKKLTLQHLENLQTRMPAEIVGLSFNGCKIADDGKQMFPDVFSKREKLKSITVSMPTCTDEEAEAILTSLLTHIDLQYLNLSLGELTGTALISLSEIIGHSEQSLKGLTIGIGAIKNDSAYKGSDALIKALKKLEKLEQLELSMLELPEIHAKDLFGNIGELSHLTSLKLFFGNIHSYGSVELFESIEVLRDSLEKLKMLENLDISKMQLPGTIMQLFAQGLSLTHNLHTLNISNNQLDEKAAELLADSIKDMGQLETLFACNCEIDGQIFGALTKSFNETGLQAIWLGGNKIKDGITNMPVGQMQDIRCIDFSDNDLSYDDALKFVHMTKGHPTLKVVNFRNNTAIDKRSVPERKIQQDELVKWKLENNCEVAFFGL